MPKVKSGLGFQNYWLFDIYMKFTQIFKIKLKKKIIWKCKNNPFWKLSPDFDNRAQKQNEIKVKLTLLQDLRRHLYVLQILQHCFDHVNEVDVCTKK